ncbi:MAG: RNA polymerase sigma factor [Flavobacteriales bacterium]
MLFGKRAYIKSLNDQQLLEIFKEKQWSACIDELYIRYGHLVYGVQLKYTKSCSDAEDLTMECFEKLPQLLLKHDIVYLKGWLHTVARNLALGFLRKEKQMAQIAVEDLNVQIAIEENDTNEIESELRLLDWALPQLKEQQKICIQLFYLQQNSYEQIMQQTGYNYNEVKSFIQNGKRKLKILMEEKAKHESN